MMKSKTQKNMFLRIIKMPIRALAKFRDMYVRTLNNYADAGSIDVVGWGAGPMHSDPLTRSFSTTSIHNRETDHDLAQLVRAATTTSLGSRLALSSVLASSVTTAKTSTNTSMQKGNSGGSKGVPRSSSVVMAKIEEDEPSEFDQVSVDNDVLTTKPKIKLFPKSRRYADRTTKNTSNAVLA